jgi:predicted transcriptional regulator
MRRTTTLSLRIDEEVKQRLDRLAESTQRSKSFLAAEAIAAYVDANAWQIEEIKQRLQEARSGAPGIPHKKVAAWLDTWGTGRRTRPPRVQAAKK